MHLPEIGSWHQRTFWAQERLGYTDDWPDGGTSMNRLANATTYREDRLACINRWNEIYAQCRKQNNRSNK